MRLHGDGSACRSAETMGMAVLSTSCAVSLKPPWRATDVGQMSVPSASRTFVYSTHRCVRWDRQFFLVVRSILPAVPRSSRPRLWSSALLWMLPREMKVLRPMIGTTLLVSWQILLIMLPVVKVNESVACVQRTGADVDSNCHAAAAAAVQSPCGGSCCHPSDDRC